jgi:hypothetical protein
MRKSIFVAAALAAASFASMPSKANDMFNVVAPTAGTIQFSGNGTASFNQSVGSNNSFQVGSSTNLGVNASTSSTPEYGVQSKAQLDLAGTSTLQQVIGTSGTFKRAESEGSSAYSAASSYAVDAMSRAGWASSYQAGAQVGGKTYNSEAEWKSDYEAAYSLNVKAGYQAAANYANSRTDSQGTDGVISGNFRTVEVGSARASGSAADWESNASASASAKYGASYASASPAVKASFSTEAAWKAAYDSEYNAAYATASAAGNRYTDSSVTVRGIGSDAKVQAASTSQFLVDINTAGADTSGSTATANGSAGANLATSSFANQSQASTANAFMQAFGGASN